MLLNTYSPTSFELVDLDPRYSAEDKLEIIRRSKARLIPGEYPAEYCIDLPFVWGAECYVVPTEKETFLYMRKVNVSDKDLLNQGIGTRLAQAAIRHALELEPAIRLIHTGYCQLGALNLAVNLFGENAVQVALDSETLYGAGTSRSLDDLLIDYPVIPGEPYEVRDVRVTVDPSVAMDWELPVIGLPPELPL
jgi:hypothetical protein